MSDYQWNEKKITKAYESRKHKKGWLNTRDIRSGLPAVNVRQLMKIMVDRELAFDNKISPDSEEYKICFNLQEKDRLLVELGNINNNKLFDSLLMLDERMNNMPSKEFLKHCITPRMRFYWDVMNAEWGEIYKGICRYQGGDKIEDFDCNQSDKNNFSIPKDKKAYLIVKINIFIKMYIALKTGWQEIKYIYPNFLTYNDLYLAIISAYYSTNLFNVINLKHSTRKYRSESDKLSKILKFPEFLRCELERFTRESGDYSKEYWISLLADYDRDPHGQGMEKVVKAMMEVANKDITKKYILDKLEDFYKAFSMIGGLPNFKSFDDFRNCYEIEQPLPPNDFDDPNFNYLTTLYECHEIKAVLRASINPMVRKAVLDWGDAEQKIINVAGTISRRKAQQKKGSDL